MRIKRKYSVPVLTIVIIGFILFSLVETGILKIEAREYRVTIYISENVLKTAENSDLAGTVSVYMNTPIRLYTYVFHLNKTNKVITLDLTEPLMKWRDFYLKKAKILEKVGERPLPTLSMFFILVDDHGNNYIGSYRYSPMEYYLSKGLKYREAFYAAARDPFEAFANKVVVVNKVYLFKLRHHSKNTTSEASTATKLTLPEFSKPNITVSIRESGNNKAVNLLQAKYCSSYTIGYCSFTNTSSDPRAQILAKNLNNTPNTWYVHVKNAPAPYMIDRLWTTFAFRLSTTYYFEKQIFSKDYVTWFATINLHPGLWTLDEYIHQLAINIFYHVSPPQFRWKSVIESKEVLIDMPYIAANVTYISKKPVAFTIDAIEGKDAIKISGVAFNGIILVQNAFQTTKIANKTTSITPRDTDCFRAIAVPTLYRIEGDGIFVNYTISIVNINGKEYWKLTPFFTFIPLINKLYSDLSNIKVLTSSSIDKELLYNITWSGEYRTVFYSRVTEGYPRISEDDILHFTILSTVSSNTRLSSYMGVGESIWLNLAILLLNGILAGIVSEAEIPIWLSAVAQFSYAEFTAYGSMAVFRLFGVRSVDTDFTALVRIDKLTLPLLVHDDYLPLIVVYRVVVDDTAHITPLSFGGSGIHYEDLENGIMKAKAVAIAPYSSTSSSWLKYKILVNVSGEYQLIIPIQYSYDYGFTSSNNRSPQGSVYLEEKILIVDEYGNTIYSWTITLLSEEQPPQPPNIPTPLTFSIKEYLFTKNITLEAGTYYLIIKTIAHANAQNGEAYIDAYSNGYYVQVNPMIRDIT
ncbi:hypothetical protein J4526_08370 [Desulfurococcaceae archaeon MEX13E-LK6-19]|nr:hypothetical protein J4526_08370 [Desulfurococcaceae archaeon MEX13E-LK6-19]